MNKVLRLLYSSLLGVLPSLMLSETRADTLRGYGEVVPQFIQTQGMSGMAFRCADTNKATVLLNKMAKDMAQTSTVSVTWQTVRVGTADVPVMVRADFGSLLLAAKGNTVYAYAVSVTENQAAAFAPLAEELTARASMTRSTATRCTWTNFSRGTGSWYPYGWGDNNTKGKPNDVDAHFTFARENDLTLQPNGGGYLLRNLLPKLHEYDRPYHFAQWLGWSPLLPLMSPEDIVLSGKDFNSITIYYGGISFGGKKLYDYRNWMFQQTVKEFSQDDNLVDWLDPNGEVGPSSFEIFWDFSDANREHFADRLKNSRGYTLASVGEAFYGNKRKFSSWDEVPIPLDYDLFGWQKDSIRSNASWRRHSGDLEAGLALGYQKPDFNDDGWMQVPMPGSEAVSIFSESNKPFWFRGTLDVPAEWLKENLTKGGPIYLQSVTLTSSGSFDTAQRYWVNGQEVGGVQCQPGMPISASIEVTRLLRPARTRLPIPRSPAAGRRWEASSSWRPTPWRNTRMRIPI